MKLINNITQFQALLLTGLLVVLCSAGCKKEVTGEYPGGSPAADLNFYAATEVMEAAYGPARGAVAIYVDRYRELSAPLSPGTGYPFPTVSFGFSIVAQHPDPASDGSIKYLGFSAARHRLYFTDINNTTILDTTITPESGTSNTLYLADAPANGGAPAAYKLVAVEEPRQVPDGKTGVRVIHLSPDAGRLTLTRLNANGSEAATNAGDLNYGQASAYQYFEASDTVTGLLRFNLKNADGTLLTTGAPFSAGKSYVIVIKGFKNNQRRMIATGKPNGTIQTATINIGNALRTDIRRSY